MTPGAKGEGAHNEPRRGSLGNEEILGKTQRGSTVGGNVTGARPEPAKQVSEVLKEARRDSKVKRRKYLMTPGAKGEGAHNETRSGSLGYRGGSGYTGMTLMTIKKAPTKSTLFTWFWH